MNPLLLGIEELAIELKAIEGLSILGEIGEIAGQALGAITLLFGGIDTLKKIKETFTLGDQYAIALSSTEQKIRSDFNKYITAITAIVLPTLPSIQEVELAKITDKVAQQYYNSAEKHNKLINELQKNINTFLALNATATILPLSSDLNNIGTKIRINGKDATFQQTQEYWRLLFEIGFIDSVPQIIYTLGDYYVKNKDFSYINTDNIVDFLNKYLQLIKDYLTIIQELKITGEAILVDIITPTQSPPFVLNPEGTLPSLETLLEQLSKGMIVGRLADLLKSLINNATRTKNAEGGEEEQQKKRKRRRRKKKRKQNKKKRPKKIKMAWIDTTSVSKWIAKLTFEFPVQKDIESDDRGTLRVHIKGGGVIKFVRVKRGTFSVISSVYGTGYRIWSQFWKRRIVNRTVLSWFIKRINANDREIAIPQEIRNKKVKYK